MTSVRFRQLLSCMLLSVCLSAAAQVPFEVTDSEARLLPEDCQAKLKNVNPSGKDWPQIYGQEIWVHLHHFCFGLNFINRARFTGNKQHRRYYLSNASKEFDYVLARWTASAPLALQAKQKKSEVDTLLRLP